MFNIYIKSTLCTLAGISSGYILLDITDHLYYRFYNRNISNRTKYNILLCITLISFLKGYTGNDLVTNIKYIFRNSHTNDLLVNL